MYRNLILSLLAGLLAVPVVALAGSKKDIYHKNWIDL